MKKSKSFLVVGMLMMVFAIAFVFFALNHPEMSFLWSNKIIYSVYTAYFFIAVVMFILYMKKK